MAILIKKQEVKGAYINARTLKGAYINGQRVWSAWDLYDEDMSNTFYIQFVNPTTYMPVPGTVTPRWAAAGSNLEYSLDNVTWTAVPSATAITSGGNGRVYLRGSNRTQLQTAANSAAWTLSTSAIVVGNLRYLLNYTATDPTEVGNYAFANLFAAQPVIEAYINAAIAGAAAITRPLTVMFNNTPLRHAKLVLNSAFVGLGALYQTFMGGANSSAAFTLDFIIPEVLYNDTCGALFQNGKVTEIHTRFTSWTAGGATTFTNWVSGVPAFGRFYKRRALPDERGVNRIPAGWEVINID